MADSAFIAEQYARMDSHAQRVAELYSQCVYAAFFEKSIFPADLEKRFDPNHLLAFVSLLGHTSLAYRRLTVARFKQAQQALEDLAWTHFPSLPTFVSNVVEFRPRLPDLPSIWKKVEGVLGTYFIDFHDHALLETNPKMRRSGASKGAIASHHLLLASFADCACCFPMTPTQAAKDMFGQDAGSFYHAVRWPEQHASPDRWVANTVLRIARTDGRLTAFIETPLGSFREVFSSPSIESAKSRLFVPCEPPVFLRAELDEFNDIINGPAARRELDLQKFLETHSQFLRILGVQWLPRTGASQESCCAETT